MDRENVLFGKVEQTNSSDEQIITKIKAIRSEIHDEGNVIDEKDTQILNVKPLSTSDITNEVVNIRRPIYDMQFLDSSDSQRANILVQQRSKSKKAA